MKCGVRRKVAQKEVRHENPRTSLCGLRARERRVLMLVIFRCVDGE